jgi:predicted GIY-YIG superfamily endonuclease
LVEGKYYTGITTDLPNRLRRHGIPRDLYYQDGLTREQAAKKEIEIKGWSRRKK